MSTPPVLSQRIILVTGAGAGIGRAAALAYAAAGATVILLGRTVSKLESVYDEIIAAGGAEPGIVPMDLAGTTPAEIQQLAEVIDQRYGRLDGLLHNAAMAGKRVPVEVYDLNDWMRVMQVNFHAVFMLTRLLLPLLRASRDASLIFTSADVGAVPEAYWGPYAVSKYAMEGLAKLLAEELANTSGVRVNIVNPGATRTGMRAAAYPNEDPHTVKAPGDLMPLYLYLMGPASSQENGKTFTTEFLETIARG
jgi:NAD(P)-dependent dehydrogenase (short-subunit alcohol dehydrogenase family)